jgi:DNA-binding CsgD family transcriptional regulator
VGDQQELIEAGRRHLHLGDWAEARNQLLAALEIGENADARASLAMASWWLNDVEESMAQQHRAHALFKSEGRLGPAAFSAAWIGVQYFGFKENRAAAEGWLAVGESLLAEAGPCPEMARLMVMSTAVLSDLQVAKTTIEQGAAIAKGFGDRDCELLAQAYLGLVRVSLGEIREGLKLLDQALALCSAGEVEDLWIVGLIYCAMLAACERVSDFARAEQWCSVGGFVAKYRDCLFSATCRACYGGVLAARGHWEAAESELLGALHTFDAGPRGQRIDALSRLAALRVRQGRSAEAARLLEGYEDHPDAALPVAALELMSGRPRESAAILQRRVAVLGEPNTQAAPLLALLTDALLAAGQIEKARAVAGHLASLAQVAGGRYLQGLAALAGGRVTASEGGDPLPELEAALDHLLAAEMPLEAAQARLAIAVALVTETPDLAASEARRALAVFERLGAVSDADAASALIRSLGGGGRTGPKGRAPLTRREVQVLDLLGLGLSNEELAARLFISRRTAEHHVSSILAKLELKSRAEAAAYALRQDRVRS